MSTPLRNQYFGTYKLVRALGDAHGASRFVLLCNRTDTNYMLYRFEQDSSQKYRRTLFDSLIQMSQLDHPHLLAIQSVSYDDHGRLCVVTPYTGNHDGLVTLDQLLKVRDGKLGVIETTRALEHLLDASRHAHKRGVYNGMILPSDILVDRYGCLQVQFYGFNTINESERSSTSHPNLIADEIRSIIELGYTMMTGLSSKDELIAPSRVIKKLDKNWDAWFQIGLDPIDGFENLEHAIRAIPTNLDCAEWLTTKSTKIPQVHIGSMIRRFKTTTTARSRSTRSR